MTKTNITHVPGTKLSFSNDEGFELIIERQPPPDNRLRIELTFQGDGVSATFDQHEEHLLRALLNGVL